MCTSDARKRPGKQPARNHAPGCGVLDGMLYCIRNQEQHGPDGQHLDNQTAQARAEATYTDPARGSGLQVSATPLHDAPQKSNTIPLSSCKNERMYYNGKKVYPHNL